MGFLKLLALILQNARRNKKNLVFSSVGITVGVAVFAFFGALTFGVRENLLNRLYPVDLIEVEPASVSIGGTRSRIEKIPFDERHLPEIAATPGVGGVFPKLKSRFQATYRMGGRLFGGEGVTFEAFFDGLDSELLGAELEQEEKRATGSGDQLDALKKKYGRTRRCWEQADCASGETCTAGLCEATRYWKLFSDRGEFIPCSDDGPCETGAACVEGRCLRVCAEDSDCQSGRDCVAYRFPAVNAPGAPTWKGVCSVRCQAEKPGACAPGQACVPESCTSGADCIGGACEGGRCSLAGTCAHLPCRQLKTEADIVDNPDLRRGEIPGLCLDGRAKAAGDSCAPMVCPSGSYCSVSEYAHPKRFWIDRRGNGHCEEPIPVVLNPLVLEIFNLVLDSTLGKAELGTLKTLLGFEGEVLLGSSFYRDLMPGAQPQQKMLKIVGFSRKALEAGVTMPIDYVRRANARFKGKDSNLQFDSVILQLTRKEKLPDAITFLEHNNIQLSRRSAEADKLRTILVLAMALFLILAVIILGLAAINITHTFLMVIYERQREIGILRSLGATRNQLRLLFLGESVMVGLFGGVLGNALAIGAGLLVDQAAISHLQGFPLKPESFFIWHPALLAASVGAAMFFSILGAFFPANRAARMDPAKVLSLP